MESDKVIKSLASYVTYRQLYDDGKRDVYFIISKFAENVIKTQKLYSFGVTELSEQIRNQFGFEIPEYVVQSSLRRLSYVQRSKHLYVVNVSLLGKESDVVSNSIESATSKNMLLVNKLIQFVEEKIGPLNVEKRNGLTREFCTFLLDNSVTNGFSELISAFILENESNREFQTYLMQIKEGAVLFAGLNYNSDISDNSAWGEEIIVYVENEILFHLAGYNGTVFQKLTEEMFSLINEMNLKCKRPIIKIRYFEEVYNEINSFFDKAIDIVEGKEHVSVDNYAMSEIVKGCQSASDVVDKKSKFYKLLRNRGILKEVERNYYADELHEYNLESPEALTKYGITDDKHRYIKHLNYINILRKGKRFADLKKCKYVVLTETGKILRMATEFAEGMSSIPLAINMNILTNRLWYDLNKGFGANDFPATFDVVIKARIILSKILTQNVAVKFDEAKERYYRKEINAEQLADSILLLREEIKKPEEISENVLNEVLSFISEDKLEIYKSEKELLENKLYKSEEERELLVVAIKKKDQETEKIQEHALIEKTSLKKKNEQLVEQRKNDINAQIVDISKRKDKADKKISKKLKIAKGIVIGGIVFYYLGVLIVFIYANEELQLIIPMVMSVIPPAISVAFSLITERRFDFLDIYKKVIERIERKNTDKYYTEYFVDINRFDKLQKALEELEETDC